MNGNGQFMRRLLLLVAVLAALWAIAIALTGGGAVSVPWGRVSSRDPVRPFVLTVATALWYYLRHRQHWAKDVGRLASVPWAPVIAGALSLAAFIIGVGWGTFVAGGADPSGYISQAEMWANGELTKDAPKWAIGAPWPDAVWTSAPLGYRPGTQSNSVVPIYSPGLPMMLAMFLKLGRMNAVYYAVPLFGMLTVCATYLIGKRLAGPWVGVVASVLMLSSPAFLAVLVQPMSDVPAAALWSLAIYAALRPALRRVDQPVLSDLERPTVNAALISGFATSLAILVRPNLAPLAIIVAVIHILVSTSGFMAPRRAVLDSLLFAVATLPSLVTIGALNAYWYGSPLQSGYGTFDYIYSLERVWPNLKNYSSWLAESQTAVILLALAAPAVMHDSGRRTLVTAVVLVFPAMVMGLYLPYLVFEGWWYLRFFLPAYPVLLVGVAIVLVVLTRRFLPHPIGAATAAILTCTLAVHGFKFSDVPFTSWERDQRYARMAEYATTLPRASVFISLNHSGTLRYYTRRDVLRWEVLDPAYLDTAVDYLTARGHDVYLAADVEEIDGFKRRFAGSQTVRRLDTATPVDVRGAVVYHVGFSR